MSDVNPIIGTLRMLTYNVGMMIGGSVLTVLFAAFYPLVKFLDPELGFYHKCTMCLARICVWPLATVKVKGAENIPTDTPYVIVPNHQSYLDPSLLANPLQHVNFKTVYKKELLYVPGIGSSLWFCGNIQVNRKDKNSGRKTIQTSLDLLKRRVPVLYFSEGTRKVDPSAALGEFKPGAFIVAYDAQVPVLPVTISGARAMLPPGKLLLGYGDVEVTIHPPVAPPKPLALPDGVSSEKELDQEAADAFKKKKISTISEFTNTVKTIIASALRDCDMGLQRGQRIAAQNKKTD